MVPVNYDQFILLGDIYRNLNECKLAGEYYQEAGKISRNQKSYSEKLESLEQQCD
jgi:hypothetical protein